MMKVFFLVLFISLSVLCGCAKPDNNTQVTVDDGTLEAMSAVNRSYTITIGVPTSAVEVDTEQYDKLYRHEGGEYELYTRVFATQDAETAIYELSGMEMSQLSVKNASRFGMPEFRFSWYDGQTLRHCSGDMVIDNGICYAVVIAVEKDVSDAYVQMVTEVFSTFGLHLDEGV